MPAQVETMMYARAVPWHGLGTKVDGLQTAADAIVAAGLDWTVEKRAMSIRHEGQELVVPNAWANTRTSDGAVLGIVGDSFANVQPADAFDWADSLVDDGSAKYETAGSLMGGRRIFLSMELPDGIRIDGDESEVKPYLLISNGYDGTCPLRADVTLVRVVCANTWTLAVKGATRSFKIRHSGSIEGKLEAAREALGITFTYVAEFQKMAERLALQEVTDRQVAEIMAKLWPVPERAAYKPEKMAETDYSLALREYHEAPDLDPIRGTGWAVLQAVGAYVDHGIDYHGRRFSADDVRMDSVVYGGTAADKKQEALSLLLARK